MADASPSLYVTLMNFLLPPRPVTFEEWGEWWNEERAPLLKASLVTSDELAEGWRRVIAAWR